MVHRDKSSNLEFKNNLDGDAKHAMGSKQRFSPTINGVGFKNSGV